MIIEMLDASKIDHAVMNMLYYLTDYVKWDSNISSFTLQCLELVRNASAQLRFCSRAGKNLIGLWRETRIEF